MNPNPKIYGLPETWHDCYYGGGSTQPWAAILHGERAKVPTWNTAHPSETPTFEQSQLRYAVDDNKLSPTTPIDNSICAIGQGTASPFRQFTIFRNDETTEHQSGEIRQVGHAYTGAGYNDNNIVNSFWFESNSFTSSGNYGNGAFSRGRLQIRDGATIIQGIDQRIWSPTGVNAHGTNKQNGNFYIAPFLSYGSRTYVLQILVWVTTADYTADFVPGTGTPAGQWRTLDDWKNNYSTKAITACLLAPRVISTYNSSTGAIGYFRVNFESSQYRKVGCGILDNIKFEFDDEYTLPEITDYGLFSANSNANIGVALFNEMTLYKWSDTLQNIGIVNSHIATYIRSNGQFMTPYIPYSNDIYDWIMSAAACFGMAFTPAKATGVDASNCVFNQTFTDPDLCLPIITDSGVANGEYTRGADNVNNDFIDLSSQWDKNYTPSAPVDPNKYSNTSYFKMVTVGSVGCKRYALSVAAVNALMGDLWNLLTTFTQDTYEQLTQKIQAGMLVSNPIESIVSLLCFPFVIPNTGQDEPIKLGKYDMTARGTPVSSSTYEINFRGIPIFPRFGNCYLDYEPYTNYEVYVPFCGTIPLKAADILGHTLNVKLIVDLFTGSCTGYIMADSLVIETITGTVAITIPVTGLDSSTINSQIVNANLNYKSSLYAAGSTIGSMVSVGGFINALSNPAETVNKIAQSQIAEEKAQYDLTHIPTQPHMVGASSPALGWCCDTIARVMIYYPTGDVITDSKPPSLIDDKIKSFGDLNGFSCLKWGKVREFSGFTLGNIKLNGVPCTESERARLKQLFSTGVYL